MDPEFLMLMAIVFLAYQIGAATGFGSSIIVVTLAVNFYPMHFLIPVVVPLNLSICTYLVIRHHAGIERRLLLKKILPLVCIGLAAGLIVFDLSGNQGLKKAYGFFVLAVSSFELVRILRSDRNAVVRPLSRAASAVWLLGCGIVQGLWVSGGPPIAYWAGRTLTNKGAFRSTLSCLFLTLNSILFLTHMSAGRINGKTLAISLALLPSLVLGIFAGEWLHVRLPEKGFRLIIFVILIFASAGIVLN